MIKVQILNKDTNIDITNYVSTVKVSGEYRSCFRRAMISLIKVATDPNSLNVILNLGDNVKVTYQGKEMFHGLIWSKDVTATGNKLDIECVDFGIYLTKRYATFKIKNMTAKSLTEKLAKDYGFITGELANPQKLISRFFFDNKLYDIIMTAYGLSDDKSYLIRFIGNKLCVLEKGKVFANEIQRESLIELAVSESLASMVNKVKVYNKDKRLIDQVNDLDQQTKYGIMEDSIQTKDSKYKTRAQSLLQGVKQKITVENLGDTTCITGNAVIIREPYTGVVGKFFIDEDVHQWQNGIYTNRLTLNYQNLMDEKEAGE